MTKKTLGLLVLFVLTTAFGCAAPGTLTPEAVDRLHILNHKCRIVIAAKVMPSDLTQYFAADGSSDGGLDDISLLFFKNGRYDHKVTIENLGAEALSARSVRQFDNKYIKLGERHGQIYVTDFTGDGFDQVFQFFETGVGDGFVVYGFDGSKFSDLFAMDIDGSYAYPIQTPSPGVLKIFPRYDEVRATSTYTYIYRYFVYTWDPKTMKYEKTGEGEVPTRADPKVGMVYPMDDKHFQGK